MFTAERASPISLLASRWCTWLAITLAIVVVYHLLWIAAMIARFGTWPNYLKVYDVLDAYSLILASTPSFTDAIYILGYEPWLETGYISPQWGIAEWSFMLIPPKFFAVAVLGAMLATFVLLRGLCPVKTSRAAIATAGSGSALLGLASATLFWVVCCANPSWIVALAMLGVSSAFALALEPLGSLLTTAGIGLLLFAIVWQWRMLTRSRVN
jgi:hypothetical protein